MVGMILISIRLIIIRVISLKFTLGLCFSDVDWLVCQWAVGAYGDSPKLVQPMLLAEVGIRVTQLQRYGVTMVVPL
jgi:hypothetical protein